MNDDLLLLYSMVTISGSAYFKGFWSFRSVKNCINLTKIISPPYDTVHFLLHKILISRWVQVGAFFLVIHSLVSTLVYGYVPTQPYFLSNKMAYSRLPIPFNDSRRISLYFLHFIYSLGATLDIKTTLSTCVVYLIGTQFICLVT